MSMGFGTLFIGYTLILNIYYYNFTDLISALVMAIALQKLSTVNTSFKNAFYVSLAFALVGLFELVLGFLDMFIPTTNLVTVLSYTDLPRYFVIVILTLFIFQGIEKVSEEVGLSELAARAHASMIFSLVVYGVSAVLSVPLIDSIIPIKALAVASTFTLFATLVILLINLTVIYKAYAKICMPEDIDNEAQDIPSRFEFINRHRERTRKKQEEYAEYKLSKIKKKASRKKK